MTPLKKDNELVPILLYIPVLHDGYLKFFSRHADSEVLWLVGEDLASESSAFHTEIRAISPSLMKKMLEALGFFREIQILNHETIGVVSADRIITASESISRQIVSKYFPDSDVDFDTVFLRYEEGSVKSFQPTNFDRVSYDIFDIRMMSLAYDEGEKSSDWWRHVGAVLVKDRQVIAVGHNRTVPNEHLSYVIGNPRDFIEAGTLSQFSDVLHSEKSVFAQILSSGGVSTLGTSLYTSVFPCPDCASFIAASGVKKCFFASGHASIIGERSLRSKGVEIVYVPIKPRT